MLQRFYSMLGGQSLGFTVTQPFGNRSNDQDQGEASAVSRLPPLMDPEDYEVRISFDMVQHTMQPLNVVGLRASDGARLQIFILPEEAAPVASAAPSMTLSTGSSSARRPEKVYDAPAHSPGEPMPYRVGRDYLVCLRFPVGRALALLSLTLLEQQILARELGALPYWSMKWMERATPGFK